MTWGQALLGLTAGFLIASVTAPVGISGAVFLLPVQLSLLHVPNPAVTPTNLLYNVVATPGALYRYWRQGQTGGRLALVLIAGTLPGVIAGSFIRARLIPGPLVFGVVVAAVLIPLGTWLVLSRPARGDQPGRPARMIPAPALVILAVAVGCVGGIYGIGGGSILGPILIASGMALSQVAPAALASTFVTSVVGVATFALLQVKSSGSIAPDWPLGIACGLGGLVGGYLGASLQPRLPEQLLRTLLGLLAIGLAVAYGIQVAL